MRLLTITRHSLTWAVGSSSTCAFFSVFSPEFFDISNHNCVRAFTFIDLDSCVLVMDYW